MAERLVRLYGPGVLSTDRTSPTTLFTVPTDKVYIVRKLMAVPNLSSGAGTIGQVVLGKTNVTSEANWVAGLGVTGTGSGDGTSTLDLGLPIEEGETLVGFYTDVSGGSWYLDYASSQSGNWAIASTTDSVSYNSGNLTVQSGIVTAANAYAVVTNTKASAPDTVSSITDAHGPGFSGMTSIVTVKDPGDTQRISIWGGYLPNLPTASAAWTITFPATQTSARGKVIIPQGTGLYNGTPTEANGTVLQSATNTFTTSTTPSVTMTPESTDGFQILLVSTNASTTIDGPSGSTELGDDVRGTPASTAAAYFISPPITNPGVTIALAGTNGCIACIEVAGAAGSPPVTVSGIVIE